MKYDSIVLQPRAGRTGRKMRQTAVYTGIYIRRTSSDKDRRNLVGERGTATPAGGDNATRRISGNIERFAGRRFIDVYKRGNGQKCITGVERRQKQKESAFPSSRTLPRRRHAARRDALSRTLPGYFARSERSGGRLSFDWIRTSISRDAREGNTVCKIDRDSALNTFEYHLESNWATWLSQRVK